MKIIYILNLDLEHKAGLYNAIHNRSLIFDKDIDGLYYNIITVDSFIVKLLKKIKGNKKIYEYKGEKEVIIDGIKYTNLLYKNSLFSKFMDKFFNDNYKFRNILHIMSKEAHDVNHIIAHFGYPHGRIAFYLANQCNKKYSVYYHGSDIHTYPYQSEKNKKYLLEVLKNADKNIFVSKGLMDEVRNIGYEGKNMFTTTNGIDTNIFYLDTALKIQSIKKTIGFVGNLERMKGADMLPDIFKCVQKRYKDVAFIVIGDGTLYDSINSRCKQLNLQVNFTGRINQKKIAEYMNQMDILILPSKKEAFGCVILEANACGAYCIGSNVGGIKEAIGDRGEVVNFCEDGYDEKFGEVILENLNQTFCREVISYKAQKYSWVNICRNELLILFEK